MTGAGAVSLAAFVDGIGLVGPGLDSWPHARAIFRGEAPYRHRPANLPPPAALPPSERRRASRAVKVALAVGYEAIAMAGGDPAMLATVFTSSSGDGYNCHELCQQLATDDRQLSPTRFHNSVVLSPVRSERSIAALHVRPTPAADAARDGSFDTVSADRLDDLALERLRASMPVGRALPLAIALAHQHEARVVLDYLDRIALAVDIARPA